MQFISPWSRGETRSLLVAMVSGLRSLRARMAAPKSLEPEETPARVRGMMESETVWRRDEMRVAGGGVDGVVGSDMVEFVKIV